MKSGNLNFLEPSGPLQACKGTALPLPVYNCTVISSDDDAAVAVSCCTLECIRIASLLPKYGNSEQTLEAAGRLQYLIRCGEISYRTIFSSGFCTAAVGLGSKICIEAGIGECEICHCEV